MLTKLLLQESKNYYRTKLDDCKTSMWDTWSKKI